MHKSSELSWWSQFKGWSSKRSTFCKILVAFLLSLIICIIISLAISIWGKDLMGLTPCKVSDATEEINAWLYFLSGAGTAVLAMIAYIQIGDINKQNRTDFLFRIDERWGSPEAIKARIIIHELYLQVQNENKSTITILKYALGARETYLQLKIGEKIIELSKKENKEDKFIYLLNFLDFMETIGYMADEGQVTVEELEALCGESLMFNYKIFKPYIEDKRARHEKKEFYAHFDNLYKRLKEKSILETK